MSERTPPWKKKRPERPRKKLTPALRKKAAARAAAAGRRYPNLVDNMWAVTSGKTKRAKKKR